MKEPDALGVVLWGVGILCLWAPAARGEVLDSSSNGFTVRITQTIQAAPADVYSKLVRNVGDWWNPEHTYSNEAHNLSIDDKPGGCFCEKIPNAVGQAQGGVRHMEVVYADPGKILRMTGGLGPLQGIAATGSMTIVLSPSGDAKPPVATALQVTYTVAGYQPKGMEMWGAPVNGVLVEQFTRFKAFVEKGSEGLKK